MKPRTFLAFAAAFAAVNLMNPRVSAQTFYFSGGALIPDGPGGAGNCGTPLVLTATSNAVNPIQDVVLTISTSHPWVGDLRIRLSYTPSGSSIATTSWVINRVNVRTPTSSGSGSDINGNFMFALGGTSFNTAATNFDNLTYGVYAPFTNNFNGTFPVVEFADSFRGLPGTGTWTLTFEDCYIQYVGVVTSASLAVQARPPACLADFNADGIVNTADLTLFLGRFGSACQ